MTKPRGLRIGWFSNSAHVRTGYGVQCKYIMPGLADMPEVEEVVQLSFYGTTGGTCTQRFGGKTFTVVPMIDSDPWGNDHIAQYAIEHQLDAIISLCDIWPLNEQWGSGFRWLPYCPIDVMPVPEKFQQRLRNAYLPITYAQHGRDALDALGIENVYIPHGCDTSIYRPMPRSQKAFRRQMDWPQAAIDGYVYGMVAANKGYPPRKGFPEAFEAFARVAAEHDDVWLYLHTLMGAQHGGPDLVQMARDYGIADRVLAPNQHLYQSGAYDDTDMARLYNCFDVLLAPSYSEGFGIPLIEAQANGVPVITTNAFAMSELCGAGWRVPWDHKLYMPIGGCYVMPNVDALTSAMLEAHHVGRGPFIDQARAFALPYDWGNVVSQYWAPLIQRLSRELTPRVYRYAERPALVEV